MKKQDLKIPEVTFINKSSNRISITEILLEEDYWQSGKNWIISHKGIEKIAKEAGIKSQINTKFRLEVQPTYENSMNHQVVAEMICETGYEKRCSHQSDRVFYSTGEASRYNTGARGGAYLRMMAEKRAYDRGVLKHLNINDSINVYAEDEAESFEQDKTKPDDVLIVKLREVLNKILNVKTKDDLMIIAQEIKQSTYTDQELSYLRSVWQRKSNELTPVF